MALLAHSRNPGWNMYRFPCKDISHAAKWSSQPSTAWPLFGVLPSAPAWPSVSPRWAPWQSARAPLQSPRRTPGDVEQYSAVQLTQLKPFLGPSQKSSRLPTRVECVHTGSLGEVKSHEHQKLRAEARCGPGLSPPSRGLCPDASTRENGHGSQRSTMGTGRGRITSHGLWLKPPQVRDCNIPHNPRPKYVYDGHIPILHFASTSFTSRITRGTWSGQSSRLDVRYKKGVVRPQPPERCGIWLNWNKGGGESPTT